jgi:ubiquinone/menaquinone biosynthesis C-methylase UbiE
MAPLVASAGSVYAVDIQPEILSFLQNKMKDKGIGNVLPVLGTEQRCGLPPGSIDKVLLVDVYHEFAFPREMMQSIFDAMRPGGLVFLVEFRAEDPAVPIKEIHKMSQKQAMKEWEAAGFVFQENIANLPWQHCLVFRR